MSKLKAQYKTIYVVYLELYLVGIFAKTNFVECTSLTLSNAPQAPYIIIMVYQYYWYPTKQVTSVQTSIFCAFQNDM